MATTLKDVMAGKVAAIVPEQEYELAPGKNFKMKLPTYSVITAFDNAGYQAKTDSKGKPVRDDDGNLVYDDPRSFQEVIKDRIQIIFDTNGLPDDDLLMPVAYRAHEDFLSFLTPTGLLPQTSSGT